MISCIEAHPSSESVNVETIFIIRILKRFSPFIAVFSGRGFIITYGSSTMSEKPAEREGI